MNLTKRLGAIGALIALVLLTLLPGTTSRVQAQGGGETKGPFYGQPITPLSMDKDLRAFPRTPQDKNKHGIDVLLPEALKNLPTTPAGSDPVRQTQTQQKSAIKAPSQSLNFDGASGDDPPDDNGDIGRQYYVQTTNFQVAFYDKFTGASVADVNINTFWSNAGGTGACNNNHNGDPVALYDTQADRYIVTDFSWTDFYNGPYYECIAISKTGDPITGGWWLYSFVANNTFLNDYPKLGVWPDAYYMMADMFDIAPGANPGDPDIETFQYVQVWALDRTSMLSGGTLNSVSFTTPAYFSMVPSNFKGTPPPAGRPNYFGVVDTTASSTLIHIFRFALNGAWPAPPATFTGPTDVTVAAFTAPTVNPPQQGSAANVLDTLGDRLMYQFQYRNIGGTESLWATQTVDAGGGTNGIRWYQLNVTADTIAAAPVQQSTYSPDATHRWMPHLAANRFGDMALGYSASSSSINPDIRYTGRLVGDAANTVQAEATLFSSSAAFDDCDPVSPATTCVSRWGDYSAMEVDPVDDCTFWYTTEYINAGGAAVTRIGSFRFNSTCAADLSITKTDTPDPVIAGNDLTYTIHVVNNGPVEATSVTMNDPLPANTTFVSLNAPAGWTCTDPGVGNNGAVNCTALGMTVSEDAQFTIVVNVSASTPNNTVLSNTATATTTSFDPTTPNTATAQTTVQTNADLETTKSHVVTGYAGAGQVTWNVTVTNNGPSDAQNVVMTDVLDVSQTTYVTALADNGGNCVYVNPTVTCTWSTVADGVSVHVDIVADLLPNALHLCNTAAAASDTVDPTPGNNSDTDCFTVPTLADVSIVKKAQVVATGRVIRYTLTVHNAGPSYAQNVQVVDKLADSTTFESVTTTQGTCTGKKKVVCKLGVLTFTDVIITIQVNVNTSVTDVKNIAKANSVIGVDPPTPDPHKKNNKSKLLVVLGGN